MTQEVVAVLERAGSAVESNKWGLHNEVVVWISKDGQTLIPNDTDLGRRPCFVGPCALPAGALRGGGQGATAGSGNRPPTSLAFPSRFATRFVTPNAGITR